jgi:hypothetical protein
VNGVIREDDIGDRTVKRRVNRVVEAVLRCVRVEADLVGTGGQRELLVQRLVRAVVHEIDAVSARGLVAAADDGVRRHGLAEATAARAVGRHDRRRIDQLRSAGRPARESAFETAVGNQVGVRGRAEQTCDADGDELLEHIHP